MRWTKTDVLYNWSSILTLKKKAPSRHCCLWINHHALLTVLPWLSPDVSVKSFYPPLPSKDNTFITSGTTKGKFTMHCYYQFSVSIICVVYEISIVTVRFSTIYDTPSLHKLIWSIIFIDTAGMNIYISLKQHSPNSLLCICFDKELSFTHMKRQFHLLNTNVNIWNNVVKTRSTL